MSRRWSVLPWRVFMWQLETQLFASSYIWLAYIFEASYSTVVTSSAKNQVSTNQNSRNRWCLIVRRTICWLLPGPVEFLVKYFTIIIPCVSNFPTYLSTKSKSYYNDVILDLRTSLGWVAAKKSSDVNFYTWYEILTIQIKSKSTT